MTHYTVAGATWEPLDDFHAGWLPGVLGLPCPPDPSNLMLGGWNAGARDLLERGFVPSQIHNILMRAERHAHTRRIA